MDSKSAFAKVSGQGLKVLLKVAKKIERFTTFKREDKITHYKGLKTVFLDHKRPVFIHTEKIHEHLTVRGGGSTLTVSLTVKCPLFFLRLP